jgi:hypothetical protein
MFEERYKIIYVHIYLELARFVMTCSSSRVKLSASSLFLDIHVEIAGKIEYSAACVISCVDPFNSCL